MFMWNMQFSEDEEDIMGDLEIKPKGTSSVMQKEVRSQRLTALLQTVTNPMLAPFVKLPTLIKELAIAQDMDPDELVNDMNEAQIFAEMLKGLNNGQTNGETAPAPGEQQGPMGAPQGVPAGATQVTHQALVMAQSEQEMRQLQGKATLLATLLGLKDSVEAAKKDRHTESG